MNESNSSGMKLSSLELRMKRAAQRYIATTGVNPSTFRIVGTRLNGRLLTSIISNNKTIFRANSAEEAIRWMHKECDSL